MEHTVFQQLNLGEVSPATYIPKDLIRHRRQTGPYCNLESIHRALCAIGIDIPAEKVVNKGKELGYSDGVPLLLSQSVVEHLGLSDTVEIQMCPEKKSLKINMDNLFSRIFLDKPGGHSSIDKRSRPRDITIDSVTERDERLAAKALEWITLLQQGNALVMQVNDAATFWCIPEALRAAGDHTHAIAVLGYETDDEGRLAFLVYDPAFNKAPIRVGPKHLANNVSTFYLRLKKLNDRR